MFSNASIGPKKRVARGTAGAGLGLSIVQAICRAHGGTVSVASTEGRGTIVEVRLPGAETTPLPVVQVQHATVS